MTLNSPRPTSIRIFLADGIPDGLRVVEKSNWTGRAVVASRAQVAGAFERVELAQPGVYVLTGVTDDGAPTLYVGEADVLRDRLKSHIGGKDFWTRFVAFTSTNEGLNKAHVRYLESRLVALAKVANQWGIENNTVPAPPPLSEADKADAEWFLQEMLVIFPLLGIDAFEEAASQARTDARTGEHPQTLNLAKRGVTATGREVGDGFIVFKGSQARYSEVASIHDWLRNLRQQLLDRQVLVQDGNAYVFTQDYRFNSPSAAAGVVMGSNANGRRAWEDERGRSLKQLHAERSASPS